MFSIRRRIVGSLLALSSLGCLAVGLFPCFSRVSTEEESGKEAAALPNVEIPSQPNSMAAFRESHASVSPDLIASTSPTFRKSAAQPIAPEKSETSNASFPLTVGAGYRQDTISWKMRKKIPLDSFFPSFPVAYSDKYKQLKMFQLEGKGGFLIHQVYFQAAADYGWLSSSHARHKIIDTFSNLSLPSDNITQHGEAKGNVFDASGEAGYQFLIGKMFGITPVVGYMYNYQKVKQTYDQNYFLNFVSGAPSSYVTPLATNTTRLHWFGPYLGINFGLVNSERLDIHASYSYHFPYFRQKYQDRLSRTVTLSNFISNFATVTHNVNVQQRACWGMGQIFSLGGQYAVLNPWFIGVDLQYLFFKTFNARFEGSDTQSQQLVDNTPTINQVSVRKKSSAHWSSFQAMFEATYKF